jgi:hypothetical protein
MLSLRIPTVLALAVLLYIALAFCVDALVRFDDPTPAPVNWKTYLALIGLGAYALPAVLAGILSGFLVGRFGAVLGFTAAFLGATVFRLAFETSVAPGGSISIQDVTISALASAGLAVVGLASGLGGEHLSMRRLSQRAL